MILPTEDQTAIRAALQAVRYRAEQAQQQPDTEAMRKALTAVRDAVLSAADLINRAEEEARLKLMERPVVHG